jgi:hypothetical protein
MKISAVFENIDAAEQAVRRLRQSGIHIKKPRSRLISPQLSAENNAEERFMVFPSAYEPYQMMFPYEVPRLNPYVIRTPDDEDAGISLETVLSFEVPDYDSTHARDILVNMHGTSIGLS